MKIRTTWRPTFHVQKHVGAGSDSNFILCQAGILSPGGFGNILQNQAEFVDPDAFALVILQLFSLRNLHLDFVVILLSFLFSWLPQIST